MRKFLVQFTASNFDTSSCINLCGRAAFHLVQEPVVLEKKLRNKACQTCKFLLEVDLFYKILERVSSA